MLIGTSIYAQEGRSKEERIKAVKVAFITEKIGLSTEQSEKFWPIYHELQKKLKDLRKGYKNRINMDNMSDAELETWIENHLKAQEDKAALHREYYTKYKTVISIRQIAQLSKAEREFKRELLKRAKERRGEGGEGREGGRRRRNF